MRKDSDMDTRIRTHAGFTLIEVLVGIVIFAIGMMALAQDHRATADVRSDHRDHRADRCVQ